MAYIWAYPAVRKIFSSTGRMIKMGLNIHHSFWTRGKGLALRFCLPVWSRLTQRGQTANSAHDVKREAALQHLLHSPPHRAAQGQLGTEGKSEQSSRAEKCLGPAPSGPFSRGHDGGPSHPAAKWAAELCSTLRTGISLHCEPAPAPGTAIRFVLDTSSDFVWATGWGPKSVLEHCCACLRKSQNRSWLGRPKDEALGF